MTYVDLMSISSGAYCNVFMSRWLRTNQIVACKKYANEPDSVSNIQTELSILERLGQHPHIVRHLHHQKEKDGGYRLTLEFVPHTLWTFLLTRNQSSNESVRLNIAYQLLTALEYCHSMQVIHRDVKPENILITESGCLKLADFNMSCLQSSNAKSSNVCTVYYRPPELYRACGRHIHYGPAIDIWSAGCVLAQLFSVSEYPVFFSSEDNQVEAYVLDEQFVCNLHQHHELVELCLQTAPADRSTASELLKFIDSVILC